MSLAIFLFQRRAVGDEVLTETELLDGGAGLAGVERTRSELWGAKVVVELGATFLPQLATSDLWVEEGDLEAFAAECQRFLDEVELIAAGTPWDADYIAARLQNMLAAVGLALSSRRGVHIA